LSCSFSSIRMLKWIFPWGWFMVASLLSPVSISDARRFHPFLVRFYGIIFLREKNGLTKRA